jgi:hypothetical protein
MIKLIGKIIDTSAQFDEDGSEIAPATYRSGYHVDAIYPVPELSEYLLDPQPETPAHQFAGVRTYHYRFADQAAWETFKAEHSDDDGNLTLTPPKPKAPARVTMRQARLALAGAGLLSQVDSAIDALDEPHRTAARIEWDYSQVVERNRELVSILGPVLGLDDEALDDLFIEAAKL